MRRFATDSPLKVTLAWVTERGAHTTAVIPAWQLKAKLIRLHRRRVPATAWVTGKRDQEVGWVWDGPEGWTWACEPASEIVKHIPTP